LRRSHSGVNQLPVGLLEHGFDQRERLGYLPGLHQGFHQLTQAAQEPKAEVGLGGIISGKPVVQLLGRYKRQLGLVRPAFE
jgi:hypothetical protein